MTEIIGEILPDPVPEHPLLNGRKEIGRGESTIVLDGDVVDGQERVFKVLSSPTDYAYYTAEDRPTGRHFPVVFADHGTAGRSSRGFPFHIVEVEKLYPLPGSGETTEVATKLSTSYFPLDPVLDRLDHCSARSLLDTRVRIRIG